MGDLMQTEIAETIFEKVKTLSRDQQEEVLQIIETKLSTIQNRDSRPIWDVITEINSSVPEEEWNKIPNDGSINHDHYLYGAPKKV
jgi:hypothetical protein